ncbi:MAG: dockerin type I domain-containing protein [Oscillospiraceae bacterium]|nr:dockerin type I domain-containing protein [Oscillospiraceae bacterium]
MKKMKRIMSAVTGLLMACTAFTGINSVNAENAQQHAMGCLPATQEDLDELKSEVMAENPGSSQTEINADNLADMVDLSQNRFFPGIGYQTGNSCTAWATTYYQFTYAARQAYYHKYGDYSTAVYSPAYTYNLINNNMDSGSSVSDAYRVLTHRGAFTTADFPADSDYQLLPGDTQKMREALNLRITDYNYTSIKADSSSGTDGVVTGNKDNDLDKLKALLRDGKLIVTSGYFRYTTKKIPGSGEYAAVENLKPRIVTEDNAVGHAFTIVGYDDNIEYDINGNGTIEECEKGAFKIANSWGNQAREHNNGFIWVMYDAINKESCCDHVEGSLVTENGSFDRAGAFSDNTFNYITVGYKDVKLTAQIDLITTDFNSFFLRIANDQIRKSVGYKADAVKKILVEHNEFKRDHPFSGSVVLDISSGLSFDKLEDRYFTDINYDMFIGPYRSGKLKSPAYTAVENVSITDNNGTVLAQEHIGDISKFGENIQDFANKDYRITVYVDYKIGDVNYDHGFDSADVAMINEYLSGSREFSNLQKDMSMLDFNGDRTVDNNDVQELTEYIQARLAAAGKDSVVQSDTGVRPESFVMHDIDGDSDLDMQDAAVFQSAAGV